MASESPPSPPISELHEEVSRVTIRPAVYYDESESTPAADDLKERRPRVCRVCGRIFDGDTPATDSVEHYLQIHAANAELPILQRLVNFLSPREL
jgi:hypothetical protein